MNFLFNLDSSAVSIFVVILVELINTVFVNSTNITTNIETAVLRTVDKNLHRHKHRHSHTHNRTIGDGNDA